MEQEKTDAKNDEKLMRQKLEFVTKEKEVLLQKIRNLEGMYQSEIGDVKNVEELMQRIKKVELESEYAKKSENNAKRESAELKMILQGLKDQITQIENQRDHYEDKFLHAEDELRRRMESEAEFQQNHRNSLETKEELLQEISRIKFRYDSILREKGMLDEENRELQERLSDNMDRIMMSSEKKNTNGVGDNRWTDLGEVLRRSGFIEVPLDYQ